MLRGNTIKVSHLNCLSPGLLVPLLRAGNSPCPQFPGMWFKMFIIFPRASTLNFIEIWNLEGGGSKYFYEFARLKQRKTRYCGHPMSRSCLHGGGMPENYGLPNLWKSNTFSVTKYLNFSGGGVIGVGFLWGSPHPAQAVMSTSCEWTLVSVLRRLSSGPGLPVGLTGCSGSTVLKCRLMCNTYYCVLECPGFSCMLISCSCLQVSLCLCTGCNVEMWGFLANG
jgi:hypothetical protein